MSPVEISPAKRFLLLVSVSICAAAGLVYELALISLSTVLNGGSIVETSLIVAGFVAALGLGALAAKPLLHRAEISFLMIELLLGLIGGMSAMLLYITFVIIGQSLIILTLSTLVIGMFVGAELPLLMTLFQRGRLVDAATSGSVLATLNAADYGAPQARRRAVLIGHRYDMDVPGFPEPTHSPDGRGNLPPYRTVRQTLLGVPAQPDMDERFDQLRT